MTLQSWTSTELVLDSASGRYSVRNVPEDVYRLVCRLVGRGQVGDAWQVLGGYECHKCE